jgi:hypothetical protein
MLTISSTCYGVVARLSTKYESENRSSMYSKVTQDCKTIEVKKEDLKNLFL